MNHWLLIFDDVIFFLLQPHSISTAATSDMCSRLGEPAGSVGPGAGDFENSESVYLDELADLLDERSIAITAPSLISSGFDQPTTAATASLTANTNIPLTTASKVAGLHKMTMYQPTSSTPQSRSTAPRLTAPGPLASQPYNN